MGDVNTELLLKTMAHIEAHLDQWDQGTWAMRTDCGTAGCFAGTACLLAGYQFDFSKAAYWTCDGTVTAELTTGERISTKAKELLGLDAFQAEQLFAPSNTLLQLRQIVSELTGVDLSDRVEAVHG